MERPADDLSFDDPCLVFALRRESKAFLTEFPPQERFPGAPGRARFCGPSWLTVLVLETGVGPRAALPAVEWLLSGPVFGNVPYRPKVVLSAGFCGALQDSLALGDVILATEVRDEEGNCWPTTWPGELPPGEWQPPLHRGGLLCTSSLVAGTEAKRDLGRRHGCLAVDMESAAVARLCRQRGVPFGCVKAVSDEQGTPLSPRLVSLLSGGRVSLLRTSVAVATAPSLAGELWQLARHTEKAGRQLGKALGELLTLTLPFQVD
jgi:adenosylhomocysteine nucleosidase